FADIFISIWRRVRRCWTPLSSGPSFGICTRFDGTPLSFESIGTKIGVSAERLVVSRSGTGSNLGLMQWRLSRCANLFPQLVPPGTGFRRVRHDACSAELFRELVQRVRQLVSRQPVALGRDNDERPARCA